MEEEADFEEAIVASPELLDQLEAAERLQHGLKDLSAVTGVAAPAMPGGTARAVLSSPKFALAATVLLAVSVVFSGSVYRQNRDLAAELEGVGAGPTQVQALYSVRSAGDEEPVNVVTPTADGQVVLLVDPGFEPYARYRATVSRLAEGGEAAEAVFELNNLTPGYEELLALALPGRRLAPGRYEVRVEGQSSDAGFEPVNQLRFVVR
jgi:hypothetical protein